jgi:hypothetical protein
MNSFESFIYSRDFKNFQSIINRQAHKSRLIEIQLKVPRFISYEIKNFTNKREQSKYPRQMTSLEKDTKK